MQSKVERIGDHIVGAVDWLGGVGTMLFRALRGATKPPFGIPDIIAQMMHLGVRSLPMASFLALAIGAIFAVQFGNALAGFGATAAMGKVAALGLVQEMVPAILAITVGVRMSAGMTSELGSMAITEQIDAVTMSGADPMGKLVWPRVVGATASLLLLVVLGNVIAMLGAALIGSQLFGIPAPYFIETYIEQLSPRDAIMSVTKAGVFGTIVAAIGCYNGFSTRRGSEAVGVSTAETVVESAVGVIVADFGLTVVFLQ